MTENIKYTRENVENNVGDALKGAGHSPVESLTSSPSQCASARSPPSRTSASPICAISSRFATACSSPCVRHPCIIARPDATTLASGYFHFVLGLDVSSTASIALYYKHLQDNQEEAGFFQSTPVFPRSPFTLHAAFDAYYEIEGFTYCTYNAFAQADLTVEIAKNGHMKVFGTSRTGQRFAHSRSLR